MRKKKISVYLSQGLGNQLFVYSYLLNLIHKNSDKYISIIIYFNRKHKSNREYLLADLFGGDSNTVLFKLNDNFLYLARVLVSKLTKKKKITALFRIFQEDEIFTFDNKMLEVPNHALVFGSFISSKYIDPIYPVLRTRITSWLNLKGVYSEKLEMFSEDVIFLHVRRGDTVGKNANIRGLLSSEYYKNSIERITLERNVIPRRIIVITDDLETSQKDINNLPITDWFGPEEISPIQALQIFSKARNFVGANSTLSWWGAKLSCDVAQNIQILPKPWLGFQNSTADDALFIPSVIYIQSE
jgi:hypothetical protein